MSVAEFLIVCNTSFLLSARSTCLLSVVLRRLALTPLALTFLKTKSEEFWRASLQWQVKRAASYSHEVRPFAHGNITQEHIFKITNDRS